MNVVLQCTLPMLISARKAVLAFVTDSRISTRLSLQRQTVRTYPCRVLYRYCVILHIPQTHKPSQGCIRTIARSRTYSPVLAEPGCLYGATQGRSHECCPSSHVSHYRKSHFCILMVNDDFPCSLARTGLSSMRSSLLQ